MNSLFLLAGIAFFMVLAAVIVVTVILVSNKSKSNSNHKDANFKVLFYSITRKTAHSFEAVFLCLQKEKRMNIVSHQLPTKKN
ncbi:hypothetical protein [Paenisporosarcina sp. OV554]|uniref:hypothetical protein n=1 Tax=Paenisporosarcina sp. OV554 TaxID=2135694 RepID=UPI000D35D3A5|nr:hypothetical protein [Paenisporosarcina sp. OV554]PUB13374.1 hypothetical protein C8K15_10763 [Paenisporosarcina sp. OV554]